VVAQKLPHHAARTVRAFDTVVTHRQQEKRTHQIHHGEITRNKTRINKNDKTTMHKLTRIEREQVRGSERSCEGKEGRKGSLRKEVMNVEFAKQTNVTPQWLQGPGPRQIVVPAWYERYCAISG
jgi:hypothetical protein